jgi:predicted MFS family arabinose efflux permease
MGTDKILNRDFILAFFAQFAFSFALFMWVPTLPIYLSRLGVKEAEIGILAGIFSVSSLVLRPIVGRALLRIPERKFMFGGSLVFTLVFLAYLFVPPFWPLFVVRVFHGIGLAFFYTASTTFIVNISPEGHHGQSLSYFFLAFNIPFALAPMFGIFLINHLSFHFFFLFCTAISLCSLFITTRLRREQVELADDLSVQERSFLNRKALPPSIMGFFTHTIWGALTAFFPLYALEQGVSNPGVFFAAFGATLILGRTLGGRILDLYSREKIILPCLITYIIAMGILAFSKTWPMFILVAIIWGAGNAFLFPALVAYAMELAGRSRGPAVGTFTALSDLGVGLGAVIMGVVLRLTNYPTMFLCLALTGAINLFFFQFSVRRRRSPKDQSTLPTPQSLSRVH